MIQTVDQLRGVALDQVLEKFGCLRDKSDASKWRTPRGTLSTTQAKFINWKIGVGGGGAIDLVMHLMHCDFKTALGWLDANFAKTAATLQKQRLNPKPFRPPPRCHAGLPRIKQYLCTQRSIPLQTVNALVNSGRLYADCRNNAVLPMLGKNANIVGAELCGTGVAKWKGMAAGSNKSLGAFIVNLRKSTKMVLCESAIDAISAFVLHPWCIAVSTAGVSANPAWLKNVVAKGYQVFCGFDSDDTGERQAQKMIQLHPTIKRLRPHLKDWNDVLKNR
jgi:hypothetical protein